MIKQKPKKKEEVLEEVFDLDGWTAVKDETQNRFYYVNKYTQASSIPAALYLPCGCQLTSVINCCNCRRETTWEKPTEPAIDPKLSVPLPENWKAVDDGKGNTCV